MKVRIGISLGPAGAPETFADAVDLIEQSGVDSLWLPEQVYSPLVEPFTGMAFALSRTRRLKVGSGVSVLPGRHPVLVAKQLASLGGSAPAGLRRVGRLADGWLGSLLTPAEAGAAVAVIQEAAAQARREVEPDHFGLSLPVVPAGNGPGSGPGGIPDALLASIRRRRPDTDPATLVAAGWDDARRMIGQYVEAGLSKFVVRPASGLPERASFGSFVDGFVRELVPLQN